MVAGSRRDSSLDVYRVDRWPVSSFLSFGIPSCAGAKGDVSRGARHSGLRSGLVVFQFTTSVVLIIATIVVYGQMHFILNTRMGFNKDQVLLIEGAGALGWTNNPLVALRSE